MKKRWVCLLALLVLLVCPLARADFGGFSDSALSSGYDVSYDIGVHAGESGFSILGSLFGTLFLFVFFGLIGGILLLLRYLIRRMLGLEPTYHGKDVSYIRPVSELHDFDEAKLLQQIPAIYVMLQEAWAAGDLTPIQPLLTIPYYAQMRDLLQRDYLNKRLKSHLEQIAVTDVKITGCMPGHYGETDRLFVSLDASFINYITNIFGSITRGNKTDKIPMHYQWEMERRRNNPNAFTFDGSTLPDDIRCDWIITRITGYPSR